MFLFFNCCKLASNPKKIWGVGPGLVQGWSRVGPPHPRRLAGKPWVGPLVQPWLDQPWIFDWLPSPFSKNCHGFSRKKTGKNSNSGKNFLISLPLFHIFHFLTLNYPLVIDFGHRKSENFQTLINWGQLWTNPEPNTSFYHGFFMDFWLSTFKHVKQFFKLYQKKKKYVWNQTSSIFSCEQPLYYVAFL